MSDKKRSHLGLIIGLFFSVLIFVAAGWLLLNRQYAMDQVSVWAYEPPANVSAVEERIDLTSKGAFYFRATQPEISSAENFNLNCPRQETGSPILGCYSSGRIYIYDITNDKLDGIEEVTAAHEMLHKVWEVMSPNDQKKIGSLLRSEYAKLAGGDLKERMDYYARTEPGELENELHSIIGTEVAEISPELETYYKKYFNDRTTILALHQKYDSVFKQLRNQAETLYQELVSLAASIEARSEQYNTDVAQLSADIATFNQKASNGNFSSMGQFNRERAALVSRSDQLAADEIAINEDIARYNDKYSQYQVIAGQIEILNKSIDSITNLEPAPSL